MVATPNHINKILPKMIFKAEPNGFPLKEKKERQKLSVVGFAGKILGSKKLYIVSPLQSIQFPKTSDTLQMAVCEEIRNPTRLFWKV